MDKKELVKELDRLVSFYVRNTEKKCFTCGKRLPFRHRQAGHYIPRGVLRTRWDIDNVHVQCAKCNVALGGNLKEYQKRLNSGARVKLDHFYGLYKTGRLPEFTTTEMRILRDFYRELTAKFRQPK